MTNIRITDEAVAEWDFCPYCGRKLEWDQSLDFLIRANGEIDVSASEDAGFSFNDSLSHCGYHIRLWMPAYGESEIE